MFNYYIKNGSKYQYDTFRVQNICRIEDYHIRNTLVERLRKEGL